MPTFEAKIAFWGWKKKFILRLYRMHKETWARIDKMNANGKVTMHEPCKCMFCDFKERNKNDHIEVGKR